MYESGTCLVPMEGIRFPGSGDSMWVPALLSDEPALQALDFVYLTKINK